jgi:hypothetical protein
MVHQGVVMFIPIPQVYCGSTISGKESVISKPVARSSFSSSKQAGCVAAQG